MGGVDLSKAILSLDQFNKMVEVIMAWPEGLPGSRLDLAIGDLYELGMVQQKGNRWFPTEAGVNHVLPSKFRATRPVWG